MEKTEFKVPRYTITFFLEENMLETCKQAIADEKLLWFIGQMQQPSDTFDILVQFC